MAKQKATNQPITAEEPIRPDEQFKLDESEMAPPSARPIGAKTAVTGSGLAKTYGARSARERRATSSGQRPSSGRRSASRRARADGGMRPEVINDILEHPTITVTEAQLREEYSYVRADLRSMFVTAAVLIVGLIVLAQLLPK
jgi:hypothetical protein